MPSNYTQEIADASLLSALATLNTNLSALNNNTALNSALTTLNANLSAMNDNTALNAALAQIASNIGAGVQQLYVPAVTAVALAAGDVTLIPAITGKYLYVIDYAITPLSTISGTGVIGLILQDSAKCVIDTTTNKTANTPTYPWSASAHTLASAYFKTPLTQSAGLLLSVNGTVANFACTSGVKVHILYVQA